MSREGHLLLAEVPQNVVTALRAFCDAAEDWLKDNQPTPYQGALMELYFESLRFITHGAPLGRIIRGMHFFGASAMILLIGIHMIRVFLMGAYKFPREISWITGVVLLGATLMAYALKDVVL